MKNRLVEFCRRIAVRMPKHLPEKGGLLCCKVDEARLLLESTDTSCATVHSSDDAHLPLDLLRAASAARCAHFTAIENQINEVSVSCKTIREAPANVIPIAVAGAACQ